LSRFRRRRCARRWGRSGCPSFGRWKLSCFAGRAAIYGWGDYGELDIVIDGLGNRKTYAHDERANVISETDAQGHTTRLTRDDKGRVITTTFADGTSENRTYDAHNRLVLVTDAKGNTTQFSHDEFGRLTETTDALGGVSRRHYEAGAGGFDAPSEITRADGVRVSRAFDGDGHAGKCA
jgi:YD repeat-containing protein